MIFDVEPRLQIPKKTRLADIPYNGSLIKVVGVVDTHDDVYTLEGVYNNKPVLVRMARFFGDQDNINGYQEADLARPLRHSEVGSVTALPHLKDEREVIAIPEVPQAYFEGRWTNPQTKPFPTVSATTAELFSKG